VSRAAVHFTAHSFGVVAKRRKSCRASPHHPLPQVSFADRYDRFRDMSPVTAAGTSLFVAALGFAVLNSFSQSASGGDWPVGAATRTFVPRAGYNWRGAKTRALMTSLWYPAPAGTSMSEHDIGRPGDPFFRLGAWSDDAHPAAGPFPLIVLSHGTGGSAQIMAWLARALASRGDIVAAVNHPGNNALEEYTAEGFLLWWERARDLTTVIDGLLRHREFERLIDRNRIGAAGFSLGGYTVIEIAGGRTDPARFREFCRSAEAEGCVDPPEFPNLFARWAELEATNEPFRRAVSQSGDSNRDSRVRAVFAIAPALGPAFIPDSLRRIRTPVTIVAGTDDRIVPIGSNAQLLAKRILRASLAVLPGVGHYTFLATCTDAGRVAQPQLCTDGKGIDRETIHERVAEQAAQFFDSTLSR
jgi:predicted dienelactone hydrolase